MIIPNNNKYQRKTSLSAIHNRRRLTGVQPFNKLSRACFYIFLLSLPFESVLVSAGFFGSSSVDSIWSLSRVTGLLMIIGLLFSRRPIYSIRLSPVWGFISYAFLYIIAAVVVSNIADMKITYQLFSFPWLILLFILCCEFLLDPTTRNQGLKVLMVAIGLCAFLQIINLSLNTGLPVVWGSSDMRISAFGEDPNFIGAQYAVGILIAILSILEIVPSKRIFKFISLFVAGVCLLALIQTGSRSAVICCVIALLALLLNKQPAKKRIVIWLMSILLIGLLVALIISNEAFFQRLQDTIIYSDTSGRSVIYQASINLFLASPFFGYGPIRNVQILGLAFGTEMNDTHNVFLWVLTASGLVGFIPFFFGYVMCFIRAFRARSGPDSIAPLALCGLAVIFSQTAGWQEEKLFWLLLAYGATAVVSSQKVKLFNKILANKRRI
jgi:O-antigen ligase